MRLIIFKNKTLRINQIQEISVEKQHFETAQLVSNNYSLPTSSRSLPDNYLILTTAIIIYVIFFISYQLNTPNKTKINSNLILLLIYFIINQ